VISILRPKEAGIFFACALALGAKKTNMPRTQKVKILYHIDQKLKG
jgi:hypothetical protein